jgi:hypothetical protein
MSAFIDVLTLKLFVYVFIKMGPSVKHWFNLQDLAGC